MVAPSVDLFALVRPAQVTVRVAGHPFALTAATAAQWLGAIAIDLTGLCGIMPGLIADEDLDAMSALMREHDDIEDRWFWAARTALGRGAGRDWWWAHNLSRRALGSWMYLNGILLRQGIDAKVLAYPDWLDACYTLLWQGADEQHQIKLDLELSARPKGIFTRQSKQEVRQMLAEFAAE